MAKKIYDDDDGRTIADMSGIQRQPLMIPRFKKKEKPASESEAEREKPEWEKDELNRKQRGALIGGTLLATIVVLAIFAAVIALVIFLIGQAGH